MLAPDNSYDDMCSIDSDETTRTEIADLAPPRVTELRLPSLSDLLLVGFCSPAKLRSSRGSQPTKDSASFSLEVSTSAASRKNDEPGQRAKAHLPFGRTAPASALYGLLFCKPSTSSHSLDLCETDHRKGDESLGESIAEFENNDHDDELNYQEALPFSIFSFRLLEVLVFTVLLYCVTYKALKAIDRELVFEFTQKSQHRRPPDTMPGFSGIDQL
jgi:hypothetical protein